MDPASPDPILRPARRVDSTDFSLDAPDTPRAGETPENLSATGELGRPAPPPGPLATLTAGDAPTKAGPIPLDSIRHAVPGYEILSELGRGGMGVVYLARQIGLNRPVALKMILSGEHAGPAERERFRREAESVAALQHANIVQIYDVGEAQGRPYLAFEFIGGGSLGAVLGGQPWPAKPAADLVEALARAMQFAHDRGIVHRDLKPANILMASADGRPGPAESPAEDPLFHIPSSALRVPKITDFGLAKRVEPTSSWSDDSERTAPAAHTRTGAVVGTPSYLAPEQAAGKNRDVGPHTDVYALGAILYELLTGRPPFRGETPLDTVLQVMADEPVPPSKLRARLPRDLETICLKCLQKDPRKRYRSAVKLADDLKRFQNGEAITARPVGRLERFGKWMRRHPAATVLSLTSALAVASLLIVSLYFNIELGLAQLQIEDETKAARGAEVRALDAVRKAETARKDAEKQKAAAEKARVEAEARTREAARGVYALQLFKAAALGERDPQRALRLLDDRARCPEELRDFTWRYVRGQCLVTEQVLGIHQSASGTPPAAHVAYSPDGSLVATVSGLDPMVRVYDVAGRRLVFVLAGHQLAAHGVAWTADGKTLATAGGDNTVRVWDLPTARPAGATQLAPRATLGGHTNTVNAVAFAPDGKRLASAGADGLVRLWDLTAAGKKDGQPAVGVFKEHTGTVWALVWSDTGLYSAGSDGRVLHWRLGPRGGKPEELFKLKKQVLALAASPDGELIAAAGDAEPDEDEPVIQLFRPLTDKKAGTLRGHTGLAVYDLSFAPNGKQLASAGRDGTIRVWDVSALQERAVFRPEKDPRPGLDPSVRAIRGVDFDPKGLAVVSGGQDGVVRLWNFAGQKQEAVEMDARAPLAAAAMSADGTTLAVAERVLNQVKVWRFGPPEAGLDPKPARVLQGLEQPPVAVAVGEAGAVVAAATTGGVYVWRDGDRPSRVASVPAVAVAVHQDNLVYAVDDGQIKWLDLKTGKPRHSMSQVRGRTAIVLFSPDGRKLVTAGGTTLQIWDAVTGDLLYEKPLASVRRITAVAVRTGDTTKTWELATADEEGRVNVWELRPKLPAADAPPGGFTLEVSIRLGPTGLTDAVGALAFTADGRTLASGGVDRAVRLRDPETGQERAALAGHTDVVLLVAFRADQVMLSVGREGVVRVWRAAK